MGVEAFDAQVKAIVEGGPSQSRIKQLCDLGKANLKDDAHLVSQLFRAHKKAQPGQKISALFGIDALSRQCRSDVKKREAAGESVPSRHSAQSFLNKMEVCIERIVDESLSNGLPEHKDKVAKVVGIWASQGTFKPDLTSKLVAKVGGAAPAPPQASGSSSSASRPASQGPSQQSKGTTPAPSAEGISDNLLAILTGAPGKAPAKAVESSVNPTPAAGLATTSSSAAPLPAAVGLDLNSASLGALLQSLTSQAPKSPQPQTTPSEFEPPTHRLAGPSEGKHPLVSHAYQNEAADPYHQPQHRDFHRPAYDSDQSRAFQNEQNGYDDSHTYQDESAYGRGHASFPPPRNARPPQRDRRPPFSRWQRDNRSRSPPNRRGHWQEERRERPYDPPSRRTDQPTPPRQPSFNASETNAQPHRELSPPARPAIPERDKPMSYEEQFKPRPASPDPPSRPDPSTYEFKDEDQSEQRAQFMNQPLSPQQGSLQRAPPQLQQIQSFGDDDSTEPAVRPPPPAETSSSASMDGPSYFDPSQPNMPPDFSSFDATDPDSWSKFARTWATMNGGSVPDNQSLMQMIMSTMSMMQQMQQSMMTGAMDMDMSEGHSQQQQEQQQQHGMYGRNNQQDAEPTQPKPPAQPDEPPSNAGVKRGGKMQKVNGRYVYVPPSD